MRVIGGRFRGRPLQPPATPATRPTSDRVREAMFNILAHGTFDCPLEGAKVLDLFAGTGALGIEALSRGAEFCMFVEVDAAARGTIRTTVETLQLTGITKIFRRDATDLGLAGKHTGFTLLFADPPYDGGFAEKALNSAATGGWLALGAIAVIEDRASATIRLPASFEKVDGRTWGDTQTVFAKFLGPVPVV